MDVRWGRIQQLVRGNLRLKILAWFFIPAVLVLIGVALVNFYAYQDVAEDLVIERDKEVTRLSAAELATKLQGFTDLLYGIARSPDMAGGDTLIRQQTLTKASMTLAVFDAGVVVLDHFGKVEASEPGRPEILGQDWSGHDYFRQIVRSSKQAFSGVVPDGPEGTQVIAATVPILGTGGQLTGALVGMFRLKATAVSAFYGEVVKLRLANGGNAYLVDGEGNIIYHTDIDRAGTNISGHPVVQQVLMGQNGALRTLDPDGTDVVAGFAPIPGTSWGLVTEEKWEDLTRGGRASQRFLLLLLALGASLPVLVAAVGLTRIVRPIRHLIQGAREVAGGNFQQSIVASSGDEIEELAQEFNRMAEHLQDSYSLLEERVTERTKELKDSEERIRAIVTGAPVVLFATDQAGVFTLSEGHGLEALGLNPGQVVGRSVFEIYRDVPQIMENFHRALGGEEFSSIVVVGGLVFDTRYSAMRSEDGRVIGVIGVATDISERRRAEQALLHQTSELAVIEERNRMAREIHDTLAQGFTGIVLQLEAAEQAMGTDAPEAQNHLDRARRLARESLQAARRSVWNLLPQELEDRSLESALEAEIRKFQNQGREDCRLTITGDRRELPPDVQAALLRICQESLTNVSKHANATNVQVSLVFHPDGVQLRVEDDGKGFDTDATRETGRSGGFGLVGMKGRIEQLGGVFNIESVKGKGTAIYVWVPSEKK